MIIFVFGLPCSGKSTFIKENFPDFKHIAIDHFQKDLPYGCTQEERQEQMLAEYEECKQALIEAIKENDNVVLEHTLLKAMRRVPYIEAVRSATDQGISAYVFNPSIETLMRMRKKDDIEAYREQINNEKSVLEIPKDKDGFAEVHIITEAELPDLSEYVYKANDKRNNLRKDHAKTVYIPADITTLENNFYGWSKVERFIVDKDNTCFTDEDGVLFNKDKTELFKYPEGRMSGTYNVPEGAIKIKSNAFSDYSDIFTRYSTVLNEGNNKFSITLPSSLTSIEGNAWGSCSRRLVAIHVHENNPGFCSRDGVLFDKKVKALLCCPAGIVKSDYVVPDTVKIINREGFSGCVNLKTVKLPIGLTQIGVHAFEECLNLLEITIPGTVEEISFQSFSYCSKLTNVSLEEGTRQIDSGAFAMCNFMKNIFIPHSVTSIDSSSLNILPSLTIHCYENSVAHKFAVEKNAKFSFVGDEVPRFHLSDNNGDAIPGQLW